MYDIALPFITNFFLVYITIPMLIRMVVANKLFDIPNERSTHIDLRPSFGGLGVVTGTVFSIFLWGSLCITTNHLWILGAVGIIFTLGILDDLFDIYPIYKLFIQIVVVTFLVFHGFTINSFLGYFDNYYLEQLVGKGCSLFLIILIINAYNLIDGIDGLLAGLSILALCSFGYIFHQLEETFFVLSASTTCGAVTAFFRYNYSPAKIFMGDTGSTVIGLLIGVMTIHLLNTASFTTFHSIKLESIGALAISISFIPIFDAVRVLVARIYRGKNPFHSDRTHIHHLLLNLVKSHNKAVAILFLVNLFCILFALIFQFVGTIFILSSLGVIYLLGCYFIHKKSQETNSFE